MNVGGISGPLGAKIATGVVFGVFVVMLVGQVLLLRRRNKEIAVGPVFALAAFCLLGLYGLGQLIDALAAGLSDVPRPVHDSLVERLVLGKLFRLGPLLPLRGNPLIAAPIHAAAAFGLYLALVPICWWLGGCTHLGGNTTRYHGFAADRFWEGIYDLCGYGALAPPPAPGRSWPRTLEPRFAAWLRPLCGIGLLLLSGAFFEMFQQGPVEPPHLPPFLWGSCVVLLAAAVVVLATSLPPKLPPAKEQEQQEPPPPPDSLAWIEALRARGFAVSATPAQTLPPAEAPTAVAEPTAGQRRWLMPTRGPLPELAARVTAGERAEGAPQQHGQTGQLWTHQREALSRLLEEDEDVLLCTAPRSGKTAVAELLCAEIAVARGQNALLVFRDEPTARAAKNRFAERLAGTDWRENLRCTLAGAEMLRLTSQKRSPVLAFAHPEPLDRLLGSHHDHRYFLEHLGLIVVEDLERHSGIRGANLAYILRRLAGILERLRARPRYLATLGIASRDFERYAETLLGVDLQLVASDGAPGASVALHPARPPRAGSDALPPAAIAAAEATAHQLPLTLAGFARVTRTELDRAAARVTRVQGRVATVEPERAVVGVAELSGARLPRLLGLTRHGGWRVVGPASAAGGSGEHRLLLLPAQDALSRWLADDLGRAIGLASTGRRLIAEPRCPEVARRHLERCLAEQSPEQRWAEQVFGRATLDRLEADGRLARQIAPELRGDAGDGRDGGEGQPARLERVCRLSLGGPRGTLGASARARVAVDTVRADPVTVIDRATGQVLRRLDAARAPLVAYPGAALLHRGRRFVVPLADGGERPVYEPGTQLAAELCEQELLTVRIRRLALELLGPERPAGGNDEGDGAAPRSPLNPLSLGGTSVSGGLVRVAVTEEITGVRRYRRAAAPLAGDGGGGASEAEPEGPAWRATISTFPPITTRYEGEAWVLTLGEKASEPAVHGLIHVLRGVLAARIDCGEEGLHVAHAADLAGQGPALLLIDTHEGGAGYARAIDLSLIEGCLRLAQRVLASDCCAGDARSGCPRCVRSIHCHQADPDHAELDRAGARELLTRLLG